MSDTAKKTEEPVVIKKYANRRLYDTLSSSYVTLENLCQMVKDGIDFVVVDAKSGEDITRSVLAQIIFEQESKGVNLLPIGFLKQVIGFYGDNLGSVLSSYLDNSMKNFIDNQDKMRGLMGSFTEFSPFRGLEEIGKQNMEIFEKTISMFSPFGASSEKDKNKKDK